MASDFSDDFILSVLKDWSYWEKQPPPTVRRDAIKQVKDWPADLIWVVQGVRRCGKSTLLAQLVDHFRLDPKQCFFINFEDPRLSQGLNHILLDRIVTMATQQAPSSSLYFFFDEIQNVDGWQRWLHRQVERPSNAHFVVTGSNATLLGGSLATALTGRHRTIELFPFSFPEYRLARPSASFDDYLLSGGFPRPLSLSDPASLLREYLGDIIERDVRQHVVTRSSLVLTQAANALFESTGSEMSLRKLAKSMGSTADTLRAYVDAFVAAYLVLPCPFFTFSERKRMVRSVKYYPIDLGLRDATVATPLPDRGKRLETAVFHHLRKSHDRVFFWREKGEVDFVVMDGNTPRPIQVTWNEAKERHEKALIEFATEYPASAEPVIVTRENVEAFLLG